MANVSIEIKGTEGLLKAINAMMQLNEVKAVVKKHAGKLQRTAKRRAVFTKGYSTGNLKRNITLGIEDSGLTGRVKADVDYSGYVEKGTRKMSAQPFMEPAKDEVAPDFIKDLQEVMR